MLEDGAEVFNEAIPYLSRVRGVPQFLGTTRHTSVGAVSLAGQTWERCVATLARHAEPAASPTWLATATAWV